MQFCKLHRQGRQGVVNVAMCEGKSIKRKTSEGWTIQCNQNLSVIVLFRWSRAGEENFSIVGTTRQRSPILPRGTTMAQSNPGISELAILLQE